jgi:competence protein ComFC
MPLFGDAGLLSHGGRELAFSDFRAAGEYGGLLKQMVLRLKNSSRHFATPLSRLMLAAGGNEPDYLMPDYVCYVPSEKKKIVERGYNPAELLARAIARYLGRPLCHCLNKYRPTLDQDRVTGAQRWENVAGAFAFLPGNIVEGNALLVDDVLTTGATADACARALIKAGASSVHVLVAARTVQRIRETGLEELP